MMMFRVSLCYYSFPLRLSPSGSSSGWIKMLEIIRKFNGVSVNRTVMSAPHGIAKNALQQMSPGMEALYDGMAHSKAAHP